jgi:hypothetical protein
MITSCNCVSGVCILCLFMPFAKVSLVEGLGSLVWVAECWGNVRTYTNNVLGVRIPKQRSDSETKFARIFRSDSKLFGF